MALFWWATTQIFLNPWKIIYFSRMLSFQYCQTRPWIPALLIVYSDFLQLWIRQIKCIFQTTFYGSVTNSLHPCGLPQGIQSESANTVNGQEHIYINKISLIPMGPSGITLRCKSLFVCCAIQSVAYPLSSTQRHLKVGSCISECLCSSVYYAVLYIKKRESFILKRQNCHTAILWRSLAINSSNRASGG